MAEGVKELAGRLIEFIDREGTAKAKLSGLRSYLLGLVDGLEYRSEDQVCPHGHDFGADCEQYASCSRCMDAVYRKCLEHRNAGLVQCSRCGKETLCPTMVEGYPGNYCRGCADILMQRKHDRAMHGLGITPSVSREG